MRKDFGFLATTSVGCLGVFVVLMGCNATSGVGRDMTSEEQYSELGSYLWETFVPRSGQSDTVQGELLRAIEKLRDECERNGNMNWDSGHEILARYIFDTIDSSDDVKPNVKMQLKSDIETILDYELVNDIEKDFDWSVFQRIEYVILDWYVQNKEPIRRQKNPNLKR